MALPVKNLNLRAGMVTPKFKSINRQPDELPTISFVRSHPAFYLVSSVHELYDRDRVSPGKYGLFWSIWTNLELGVTVGWL